MNHLFNMKKLMSITVIAMTAVLLAGCGSSNQSAQSDKDNGKMIVAINATFPPFESVKEGTSEYTGIDIDIANYIGKKLGKQVEFKDMKFASLVPTLQSGRADLIVSGISPTDERKETVDFTKSYYFPMKALVCKKGAGLSTMDSLKGKKAGASMGTTYAKELKDFGGIDVAELDSTPLVVQDIKNGRLDAGLFDSAQASVFVNQNQDLEMHILQLPIIMDDSFAIAVPKGSADKDKIDAILAEMKENGEMHKILVKYLGEAQTKQYEDSIANLDIAK